MRAKKDCFVRACSSSFHENNEEDLKVIDVSPIKSLFCNINLDNDGTGDESTLVKRRPNDSEFLDLDAKIGKSGIGEVKTLHSNEPTCRGFVMADVLAKGLSRGAIATGYLEGVKADTGTQESLY